MNKSVAATKELEIYLNKNKIELALIQEPAHLDRKIIEMNNLILLVYSMPLKH